MPVRLTRFFITSFFSFLLSSLILLSAFALEEEFLINNSLKLKKPISLQVRFKQKGESFENDLESSFLYTIDATPTLGLKINNSFSFDSKVSINSRIGSVQSRFGDLRSRSAIIIRDTRVRYFNEYQNKNTSFGTQISVGAIDQGSHHQYFSNFVSTRALPGIEEILQLKKENIKASYGLEFKAFQGVPTAQSNTLDFIEKESTPFFIASNLEAFYERKNRFLAKAHFGLFSFTDLPAAIADESRLYGNSVDFVGAAADFKYGFRGWRAGWNLGYTFPKAKLELGVQMLQNLDAPDTRNQAQRIFLNADFKYSKNLLLQLSPYTFFTESDASIASYNSLVGHNNREGFGLSARFKLPKRKFNISVDYAHSDVIEENSLQLEQDFFGISLEYKNDFF